MVFVSYGGGVFIWQKQKPHRRFGSGVWKALVNESKPDRRAAQQQRLKQQVQIQITIHTVLIGYFAVLVKFNFSEFPAKPPPNVLLL
jgi:hypothetical protein